MVGEDGAGVEVGGRAPRRRRGRAGGACVYRDRAPYLVRGRDADAGDADDAVRRVPAGRDEWAQSLKLELELGVRNRGWSANVEGLVSGREDGSGHEGEHEGESELGGGQNVRA